MADQYLAADERAREARRAGLQAKKDEQPHNTARSYAAKQREWKVRRADIPLPLYPSPLLPSRPPGRPGLVRFLTNQLLLIEVVPHAAYGR